MKGKWGTYRDSAMVVVGASLAFFPFGLLGAIEARR